MLQHHHQRQSSCHPQPSHTTGCGHGHLLITYILTRERSVEGAGMPKGQPHVWKCCLLTLSSSLPISSASLLICPSSPSALVSGEPVWSQEDTMA